MSTLGSTKLVYETEVNRLDTINITNPAILNILLDHTLQFAIDRIKVRSLDYKRTFKGNPYTQAYARRVLSNFKTQQVWVPSETQNIIFNQTCVICYIFATFKLRNSSTSIPVIVVLNSLP